MRILALDVGTRRIGVAISDETQLIAQPLEFIDVKVANPVREIVRLCKEHQVKTVVIGLPLSMSGGDRGDSSRRAKSLGNVLAEKAHLEVVYFDERFTTTQADRMLIEGNVTRQKRKQVVDKIAASLILQGYLDGRKSE
ncbi:MAG: Holliday junction resolvase RuvX [Deltaproteobacteria bacterium]|nr:Holliday junction resolvase RuvX [Deltaproteobacteria bacterium]MBN2672689.1 Holliday junction resolvase RuvX [Deltaproteobacteria bacterium]